MVEASIKRREPRRGALTSRSHLETLEGRWMSAPFHRPVPRTPPANCPLNAVILGADERHSRDGCVLFDGVWRPFGSTRPVCCTKR